MAATTFEARFSEASNCPLASRFPRFDTLQSSLSISADLTKLVAPLIYNEFRRFRPNRINAFPDVFDTRERYENFVTHHKLDRMQSLINSYGLAFDLVLQLTHGFADNLLVLLQRFKKDEAEIGYIFKCDGLNSAELCSVMTGLSDRHRGGTTVCSLHFINGQKLIYKPRDLQPETTFYAIMNEINRAGLRHSLTSLTILARETSYGWMEFVNADNSCPDDQVVPFFYRCGVLVCIAHMLAMTDCHNGNLVACRGIPFLLDAETVGHTEIFSNSQNKKRRPIEHSFQQSVMRTGFFTYWKRGSRDSSLESLEQAAFVNPANIAWRAQRCIWHNIGTDGIHFSHEAPSSSDTSNLPRGNNGEVYEATNFINDICSGFSDCWDIIAQKKRCVKNIISDKMSKSNVRFIFRDTDFYEAFLHDSLRQANWKDATRFQAQMQKLASPLKRNNQIPTEIFNAESISLHNYDVPYFTVPFDGETFGNGLGTSYFKDLAISPSKLVMDRIAVWNEAERDFQVTTIQRALEVLALSTSQGSLVRSAKHARGKFRQDTLMEQSLQIGLELLSSAVRRGDRIGWIAPVRVGGTARYNFRPIDGSFYGGKFGIGVFFSSLYQVYPDRRFKNVAATIVSELASDMAGLTENELDELCVSLGDGMSDGLAGIIFALTCMGVMLGGDRELSIARNLALRLRNRSGETAKIGIFDGVAGDILALVEVSKATGDAALLEEAVIVGRSVLHKLNSAGGLRSACQNFEVGFAHGASGIGWSLARLFVLTGIEDFRAGALQLLRYEVQHWCGRRNTASLQSHFANRISTEGSWCSGIIGAAFLASLIGENLLLDEACPWIWELLVNNTIDGNDTVCCGSSGRLLALSELRLLRKDRYDELQISCERDLVRLMNKRWTLANGSNRLYPLGLYDGLAGIGMGILQHGAAVTLPCVTTFGLFSASLIKPVTRL